MVININKMIIDIILPGFVAVNCKDLYIFFFFFFFMNAIVIYDTSVTEY